jgi:uncharacterized alpha-E superfamily protein
MLARLADARSQLHWLLEGHEGAATPVVDVARIDGRQLETILVDLASLVGLWNESVVHGPAWRFGEIGRRLERAFGVVDGVRGACGLHEGAASGWLAQDSGDHRRDFHRQRVVEIVLATNESLVAYRRRHRSDVELDLALQLVIADEHNPRAARAAIRSVRHQADRLGWEHGVATADELLATLDHASFATLDDAASVLTAVYTGCDRLARDVVGSYLAAPVDPRMMGRG